MIPILMYHKIGAPVRTKSDTFLNISVESFARQIRLLARWGYRGVTFEEVVRGLAFHTPLPRRPLCVTFDDGYVNVNDKAAPILKAVSWPATVFVPTAFTGRANEWDREAGRPVLPIMDWRQLRSLQNDGWEIAGHTRAHRALSRMGDRAALEEIMSGVKDMADHLGHVPRTFCYPFGSLNSQTPSLVKQCAFLGACTTRSGLACHSGDPFLLPRVKVAYRDDIWGLLYRLLIRPRL